MDTIDRIKELCKENKMNQQALAEVVGVKEDTVSNWFRRKSASYTKYLPQIAEALGTTTEYLLTGEGPKERSIQVVPGKWADVSDDQIKAAFFEGAGDLTKDEMDSLWDDARDYMRYKLEQRRKRQQ